jgi:2-oxoisovalerate dehydrogenase E2 component (dihydrolipoyl transacylase)
VSDLKQFKLPDVGEGLTEADILKWLVQPGDTVVVNQALVEVETAKAAVELPSPYAGVVSALHAAEGDTVDVGRPIITIDTAPGAPPTGGEAAAGSEPADTGAEPAAEPAEPARQPVLVGYGPRAEAGRRRPRKSVPRPDAVSDTTPTANAAFQVPPVGADVATPENRHEPNPVLAKPPVRKLAKSLGVDLATVDPTGPNGSVSRADVEQAAERVQAGEPVGAPAGAPVAPQPGQRETRIPVKGVRKHTAAAMVASAFTAPHVTEFITVDISATMSLRDRVGARREFAEVKVSPLLFVAKAVILAAARTPQMNATWDEARSEIVLKHYVNLGIAAATERGLVVPSIKDADRLSLLDLARAINSLTETARAGRATPADLTGGTITITNVGVFGVDSGTPIINPGESSILAFGAVRRMPWVVTGPDGQEVLEPRWVTQLAVSFDHRIVDGEQGSRFLADVAAILTDPGLALL